MFILRNSGGSSEYALPYRCIYQLLLIPKRKRLKYVLEQRGSLKAFRLVKNRRSRVEFPTSGLFYYITTIRKKWTTSLRTFL